MAASLVQRLETAARAVSRAAAWKAAQPIPQDEKENYLFEFHCYCRILVSAKREYVLQPRNVKNGRMLFPKAPANKDNFSYFKLISRKPVGPEWQLCTGISIVDRHGKERHPDVSLPRSAAPNRPCCEDVLLIWDAKYHYKPDRNISTRDYFVFLGWMRQLKIAAPMKDDGFDFLDLFSVSAILTNGEFSTELDETCLEAGFSEIKDMLSVSQIRPTRYEHEQYNL